MINKVKSTTNKPVCHLAKVNKNQHLVRRAKNLFSFDFQPGKSCRFNPINIKKSKVEIGYVAKSAIFAR